jgi:hypothetical protein
MSYPEPLSELQFHSPGFRRSLNDAGRCYLPVLNPDFWPDGVDRLDDVLNRS